jgi:hypothetical protein
VPDYKSSVSFDSVPGRVQQVPLGSKVFGHDTLHLKEAL